MNRCEQTGYKAGDMFRVKTDDDLFGELVSFVECVDCGKDCHPTFEIMGGKYLGCRAFLKWEDVLFSSDEIGICEEVLVGSFDPVEKPSHYASGDIECIDAMRAQMSKEEFEGHMKGNVIKYMWRWRDKGGVESLKKARWYLNKLIEEAEIPYNS
jgi:hypothetical protein